MAMEIKTLDIKNEAEAETIEFWTQFGWNLKSSQRVYNKDTHLERRGDDTYSVTETVDYTKLVFERDKNGPHYAEIVALEDEFFRLSNELDAANSKKGSLNSSWKVKEARMDFRTPESKKKSTTCKVIGILSIVLGGLLFMVGAGLSGEVDFSAVIFVIGLAFLAFGIPFTAVSNARKNRNIRAALNAAKEDPNSENGKIYQKEYKTFCKTSSDTVDTIERCENRLGEIFTRLDEII